MPGQALGVARAALWCGRIGGFVRVLWFGPAWKGRVSFAVHDPRVWRAGHGLFCAAAALVLGGCFLAQRGADRPDPAAVTGTPVYAERCDTCHAARVGAHSTEGPHAARGIRCGQCHRPEGHPDFAQPVQDATCAGCHQPQYQQVLESRHFATRQQQVLNADRAARVSLRREGFVAATPSGPRFVGDSAAGDLGGRLCAACHYDEHRLGAAAVQRELSCTGCHANRDDHYPMPASGETNRCVQCHMRVGATASGQPVSSHRFAVPGTAGGRR